jgi:hypothetical protein
VSLNKGVKGGDSAQKTVRIFLRFFTNSVSFLPPDPGKLCRPGLGGFVCESGRIWKRERETERETERERERERETGARKDAPVVHWNEALFPLT